MNWYISFGINAINAKYIILIVVIYVHIIKIKHIYNIELTCFPIKTTSIVLKYITLNATINRRLVEHSIY